MSKKGKLRPRDLPSIRPGVTPSRIPSPALLPRPTKRTSFTVRGTQTDEIDQFVKQDKDLFGNRVNRVRTQRDSFCCPTIAYLDDSRVYIQSTSFSEGVPKFVIEIEETLTFKCFHMGIKFHAL